MHEDEKTAALMTEWCQQMIRQGLRPAMVIAVDKTGKVVEFTVIDAVPARVEFYEALAARLKKGSYKQTIRDVEVS